MINAWTDYEEYATKSSWFMRSQILPGNTWRMLKANDEGGVVTINEERPYVFRYELEDLYGNRCSYRFTIKGKQQPIDPLRKGIHYLKWNQGNVVQQPGMELEIPKGMLYDDVDLNCRVIADSLNISFDYQLHDKPLPLHRRCPLRIAVRSYPITDMSKYYVVRKHKGKKVTAGGHFKEGYMHTAISELGTYSVALDTVAPRIVPLNKPQWKTGNIQFKINDAETGIKDYKVYIDGGEMYADTTTHSYKDTAGITHKDEDGTIVVWGYLVGTDATATKLEQFRINSYNGWIYGDWYNYSFKNEAVIAAAKAAEEAAKAAEEGRYAKPIKLVDDGSTDKSGTICDTYQKRDSRIVVIHQETLAFR